MLLQHNFEHINNVKIIIITIIIIGTFFGGK